MDAHANTTIVTSKSVDTSQAHQREEATSQGRHKYVTLAHSQGVASPLLVRVDKYEQVFKASDKVMAAHKEDRPTDSELPDADGASRSGAKSDDDIVKQSVDFSIEALLCLAQSCEHVTNADGPMEERMTACLRGIDGADAALRLASNVPEHARLQTCTQVLEGLKAALLHLEQVCTRTCVCVCV